MKKIRKTYDLPMAKKGGRQMTTTKNKAIAASGLILAAAIALTACTPSEPAPSNSSTTASPTSSASNPTSTQPPEPTANTADAPKSAQDAIQGGTSAINAYFGMNDVIFQQGGKNPERIKAFAIGEAIDFTQVQAKTLVTKKAHFVGSTKITIQTSYPVDLKNSAGKTIVNGGANFAVCRDRSSVKGIQADGKKVDIGKAEVISVETQYDPAHKGWVVSTFSGSGSGTVVAC